MSSPVWRRRRAGVRARRRDRSLRGRGWRSIGVTTSQVLWHGPNGTQVLAGPGATIYLLRGPL